MGNVAFEPSDRETVRRYERGELTYKGNGVWYDAPDDKGERTLNLYPAPSGAATLIVEWVFRPEAFAKDSEEPTEFPEEFHPKLLHFAAATYYRTLEDNPELAAENARLADEAVAALTRYDNMRGAGEGIFQVPILGSTA